MTHNGLRALAERLERRFREDALAAGADDVGGGRMILRTLYMVWRGFLADHCIIRASALTYITMLSIVPLLAVAFSIAKGFGLQNADFIRNFLMGVSAGRGEVVAKILQYIGNTNVRTLGWIGVGTLLVTVFTTVGNVEKAFNDIWGVKRGRSSWRKFTDFFSVIVVCPIVALAAASFTVMVQKLELVHAFLRAPEYDSLEKLLLKFLSLALLWVGFTFAYSFVPNTRVRMRAAFAGGIVAGSLWQGTQWLYIHWQIGFGKYNAIYGSFAQLPLFLVWLYISWIIVLLGAELSYAVQHPRALARRGLSARLGFFARRKAAVAALRRIAARFAAGLPPETAPAIAALQGLSVEEAREILDVLAAAGFVVVSGGEEDEAGYVLAVAAERIRMADVLRVLGAAGCGPLGGGEADADVERYFADMETAFRAGPYNVSLAEFAQPLAQAFAAPESGVRLREG